MWMGGLFYLAGFLTGCATLVRRPPPERARLMLVALLAGGLLLQMAGLYLRGLASGGCPLGNKFEIVQFVAWSAIVLYFVVGPAFRVSLLGLFTAGYAAVLALVSLAIPQWDAARSEKIFGNNPWVELHAALAVFSYGVFGILALTSLMHLVQTYSLKHKHLNGLFWFLPSIAALDQINFRLLVAGQGLLTFSLAVGIPWFLRNTRSVDSPKLLAAEAVWLAYLVVLVLRWRGRLFANRFAWVCVGLFLVAMLSLGPVNASRHGGTPRAVPAPAR
jgi:ABC-type uncharacterized transport system permease subunit